LFPSLRFDNSFLMMLVAILGTTISPYLFFWQANQEVEEEIAHGSKKLSQRKGATDRELKDAAWDVNIGMLLSNVVMYFIMLATAATLHQAGRTDIASAADAAQALRPLAGDMAFLLMALALIGTGVLAVPILTASAAYAVAETFGWKCGLDEKPGGARQFYLVMGVSTIVALFIAYWEIDVMKALFWTAVINGFLAPPLLVIIMLIANKREVMGKRVNSRALNVLGWTTTLVMFAAAIALVVTWGRS
jgi:Mn2+/Fe2+ NRAMP family transporter